MGLQKDKRKIFGTIISSTPLHNVSEYIFDEQNQKAEAEFNVVEGTFRTITGKIGKTNPDKFKLQTKSASIGIRGTIFGGDENKVFCEDGQIAVNSNGVEVIVNKDEIIEVSNTQPPSTPRAASKQEKEAVKENSGSNDPDMQQNEQEVVEQKNSDTTAKEETKQEEATDETAIEEGSFEATPTPIPQETPNIDNVIKNVENTKAAANDVEKQDVLFIEKENEESNVNEPDVDEPDIDEPYNGILLGKELSFSDPGYNISSPIETRLRLTPLGIHENGKIITQLEYEVDSGYQNLATLYFDNTSHAYSYSNLETQVISFDKTFTYNSENYTVTVPTYITYDNKGEFITLIQGYEYLREIGQDFYTYETQKLAFFGKSPTMNSLTNSVYKYSILGEMEMEIYGDNSIYSTLTPEPSGFIYLNGLNQSVFLDSEKYINLYNLVSNNNDIEFGSNFNVMRLNDDGTITGANYSIAFGDGYQHGSNDTISGSLYGSELQGLALQALGQKFHQFDNDGETSLLSTAYLVNKNAITNASNTVIMNGYLTGFALEGELSGSYGYMGGYVSVDENFGFTINKTTAGITGSKTDIAGLSWNINANNDNLSSYYIDNDKFGALFSTFTVPSKTLYSNNAWFFSIPDKYVATNNTMDYDVDDYSSWGYWTATLFDNHTTKENVFYVDQHSTWVAGELTPTSTIQNLINSSATYNFSGNVLGSISENNGMGATPILMDSYNRVNLQINFASGLSGDIKFKDDYNQKWHASIASGTVTTTGFNSTDISAGIDDEANISDGSINGKFYGPNVQSVGGKFELNSSNNAIASGVFKAKKQ